MKKISLLPFSFILLLWFGIYWVYASSISIVGKYGVLQATGSFSPGWNAGTVTLMNSTEEAHPSVGIPWVTLEGDNTLTGNLFLQSVGYVHLWHNTQGNVVQIIPPAGTGSNLLLPWAVNWSAWSTNAGWISFESQTPSMYSWVYYIPATGSFTGLAWSATLGYIDFSLGGWASDNGLVGRVKVIGNAGWTSSYDSLFLSNNWVMRTNSVLTPFINNLHKNTALLTRNAPPASVNTIVTTQKRLWNLLYYKLSWGIVSLSVVSDFCKVAADSPRSIIVDWGDILIDRDVSWSLKSCAIIALSNGTIGGNIYLSDMPKTVESYIIAEGSVYNGTSSSNLYNDAKSKLSSLPQSQLYIRGWVISHNTIWWATTDTVALGACPYTEGVCNRDTAIKYDLNFFRNYTKRPVDRAYKNDSLDDYSIIIEYDSRSAGDPPPGI